MTQQAFQLIVAMAVLVLLTFVVGIAMLVARVQEMRDKRIHPQSIATASKMAMKLDNVQAADNFRNLLETPVLFYALAATAVGVGYVPQWLVIGAWAYVSLRVVHSLIHCTYNKIMHRLLAYLPGFGLVVAMWLVYIMELASGTGLTRSS